MKKLFYIITGILLISLVVAGVGVYNSTVSLSKERKEALASVGITAPEITSLECDGTFCRACMFQIVNEERVGAGCIAIPQTYCTKQDEEGNCLSTAEYSDNELETMKEEEIKRKLEKVADVIIKRNAETTEKKDDGGTITINEK